MSKPLVSDELWAVIAPLVPFNASGEQMAPLAAFNAKLSELGLHTMARWNGIFVNPPLIITEEQLREGLAILDAALEVTDCAVA